MIGMNSGSSNNSVLVTGIGSFWTNTGNLYIGYLGSGNRLVISNGATVAQENGWVGNITDSSNNSVLVTGAGSLWSNSSDIFFGNSGANNSLVISNGGIVAAGDSYININVASSNNSVLVTGSNSLLSNSANLYFGLNGSGSILVISNGGEVANRSSYVGLYAASSNNSVLVTGQGSTWSNGGSITIGDQGRGTLTVASGGAVSAGGITIANSAGSAGTMNIGTLGGSDTAGSITVPAIAFGSGSGTLNFNQTGAFALSSTVSASGSGNGVINQFGSGTTILTGNNSGFSGLTTISNGALQFGDGMTTGGSPVAGAINNNASLVFAPSSSDTYTVVGNISGSGSLSMIGAGAASLSGSNNYTGSTLITSGVLQASSTNALGGSDVTLGGGSSTATLSLSTNLTIASLIWSSNSVMSFTPGAQHLVIDGAFTSSGGGVFDFASYTNSATNTLVTFGTNSGFSISSFSVLGSTNWHFLLTSNSLSAFYYTAPVITDLYVGSNSSGVSTSITAGTNSYSNTYVGYNAGASNNLLTVANTNTQLTNSGNLYVGYSGSGNLMVISNGANVADINGWVGNSGSASNNSVLVSGAGSHWTNAGAVIIGNYFSAGNSLTITDGASVYSASGAVGDGFNSSSNTASVSGSDSRWVMSGNLTVGEYGNSANLLVISNGGAVLNSNGIVGINSSANQILVTGGHSLWTNSGNLTIGSSGSGNSLVISNGGAVVVSGDAGSYRGMMIGFDAGAASNSVLVTESNSLLTVNINFYIGYGGSDNSVTVSNRGTLGSYSGFIGYGAGASNNSVLVTGANSTWNNTGDLYIGEHGAHSGLMISDGGHVSNGSNSIGAVLGWNSVSSNNSVLVTGSGSTWSNAGNLYVGYNGSGNNLSIAAGAHVTDNNGVLGQQAYVGSVTNVYPDDDGGWYTNISPAVLGSTNNSAVITGS
jgi:T5SS/PEP-CTERM-associated repeat protein/autotransporter-associated beta strand protein